MRLAHKVPQTEEPTDEARASWRGRDLRARPSTEVDVSQAGSADVKRRRRVMLNYSEAEEVPDVSQALHGGHQISNPTDLSSFVQAPGLMAG